jgi:hypothetical protein
LRFAATTDLLRRFAAVRSGVQFTKAAGSSGKGYGSAAFSMLLSGSRVSY